jgi:hypothetical protein
LDLGDSYYFFVPFAVIEQKCLTGSCEPKADIRDSNFHKSFKYSFIAIEEAVTVRYGSSTAYPLLSIAYVELGSNTK